MSSQYNKENKGMEWLWCSTPYGIKGMSRFGNLRFRKPRYWCSTPYGIKGMSSVEFANFLCDSSCAQRLTASKVCPALYLLRYSRIGSRAQRLTASKVCPGAAFRSAVSAIEVLNALRHQRYVQLMPTVPKEGVLSCSTPYGIKGMSRKAFCAKFRISVGAQRLTASKVCPEGLQAEIGKSWSSAQRLTASKVCPGKKGLIVLGGLDVLNALRHQRYVQKLPARIPCDVKSCSTPYGIKGMSSSCSLESPAFSLSAQRLTASKVCPVASALLFYQLFDLCSTPYGIKGMSRSPLC